MELNKGSGVNNSWSCCAGRNPGVDSNSDLPSSLPFPPQLIPNRPNTFVGEGCALCVASAPSGTEAVKADAVWPLVGGDAAAAAPCVGRKGCGDPVPLVGFSPGGLGDEDFGEFVAEGFGPGTGMEVSTAGVFASPFPCVAAAVVTNCAAEKVFFFLLVLVLFLPPKNPQAG